MSQRAVLSALILAFASSRARADESAAPKHPWVPTVGIALGSFDEQLRVRVDSTNDSYRGQLRAIVAIGLAHPVVRLPTDRLSIDGHASLGLGLSFNDGHWQLPLREDVTVAYDATAWLVLRAGLGVGLTLDTTSSSLSFGELAVPMGVTLFHTLDLVYRPMLAVPLGKETTAVSGGVRELSTRLTVLPFEVLLRVRFGGFG